MGHGQGPHGHDERGIEGQGLFEKRDGLSGLRRESESGGLRRNDPRPPRSGSIYRRCSVNIGRALFRVRIRADLIPAATSLTFFQISASLSHSTSSGLMTSRARGLWRLKVMMILSPALIRLPVKVKSASASFATLIKSSLVYLWPSVSFNPFRMP